jgi:hypothetical protein
MNSMKKYLFDSCSIPAGLQACLYLPQRLGHLWVWPNILSMGTFYFFRGAETGWICGYPLSPV